MDSPGRGVPEGNEAPVGDRRVSQMCYTEVAKLGIRRRTTSRSGILHAGPFPQRGVDCQMEAPARSPGRSCPPSHPQGRHWLDVVVKWNVLFLCLVVSCALSQLKGDPGTQVNGAPVHNGSPSPGDSR